MNANGTVRRSRCLGAALLATVMGVGGLGSAASLASAAEPAEGCAFGTFSAEAAALNNVCWLQTKDWKFEPGASTQQSVKIGQYTMKYTVVPDSDQRHNYTSGVAPSWEGSSLGHADNGVGVPLFYNTVDPKDRTARGDYTLALKDISVVDSAGKPAQGWSLVMIDGEATHAREGNPDSERLQFRANTGVKPFSAVSILKAIGTPDTTCEVKNIDGGLECFGAGLGKVGAMVGQASAPTSASISLRHIDGSGMGGAFGILVPKSAPVAETTEDKSPEVVEEEVTSTATPEPTKSPEPSKSPEAPKPVLSKVRPLASTGVEH